MFTFAYRIKNKVMILRDSSYCSRHFVACLPHQFTGNWGCDFEKDVLEHELFSIVFRKRESGDDRFQILNNWTSAARVISLISLQ